MGGGGGIGSCQSEPQTSAHPIAGGFHGWRWFNQRSISPSASAKQDPEAPTVVCLAETGANARVGRDPGGESVPVSGNGVASLMVAVEKSKIKGVLQERGSTAILVVGDSDMLSNYAIDWGANRDFAGLAVNWLLDETQLLPGLGSHPVTEYKLIMTNAQVSSVRWLLLAAVPGGILLFGGFVWFQRRH